MALTEQRVSTFRTNDTDTSGLAVTPQASEWTLVSTVASAGVASVNKAAVTGKTHYVTACYASFDAAHIGLLIVNAGTVSRFDVHNQRNLEFGHPIEAVAATAVNASLNVTSFNGALVMHGYTA